MRERPRSLAVPPFEATERLTVSDPKQMVSNDSYPAVKATADSGSPRAET
jgi:hypothetical protein